MASSFPAPLRVSAVQCNIHWNDVSANLQLIESLIRDHAATSDLIVFPETITTGFSSEAAKLADREQGEAYQTLLRLSHEYNVALAGSYLSEVKGFIQNLFFLIEPNGKVQLQAKRHLFAPGGEKEFVSSAASRSIFTFKGWHILPIICYDLRFPELFRAQAPADLIMLPAAFTYSTGKAHWELLLRARAVENQCYLVAAAQTGTHENGRRTFGHSMIIDPWGDIIAMQPENEGIALATIDKKRIQAIRESLPALQHRVL